MNETPTGMLVVAFADEHAIEGGWSMPVGTMHDLIEAGEEAVPALIELLSAEVDESSYQPVWTAVVLGQIGSAVAAPGLAAAITNGRKGDYMLMTAASEALAAIGRDALPAIRTLAQSPEPRDRLWAYYAAGLIGGPEAGSFLSAALDSDPEMVDVIACAMGDVGDRSAIDELCRILPNVEPWQRPELESTIQQLHGDRGEKDRGSTDWRLRYRVNNLGGRYPLSWAVITDAVRGDPELRATEHPLRSFDEIIRDDETSDDTGRCECCDVEKWTGTGMSVCPQTAAVIAAMQADFIGRLRDETGSDDIFDAVDLAESDLLDHFDAEPPEGRRAIERHDDERSRLGMTFMGLAWAIENGADSVSAGCDMLLTEAEHAADIHGDPFGVFKKNPQQPVRAGRRVGRNDPCPCGSGRKYKKCCGRPGVESAAVDT